MDKIMRISSGIRLDKTDWKILHELDSDAWQPFAKIGKKLRIGRDIVAYRVRRLEESGVIEKYISVIDFGKIGYTAAALYVKFHHVTPQIREEILKYYVGRPDVWWCFDMAPEFDFAIGWFGRDICELRDKQLDLLGKYCKYFRNFKVRMYSHFYHFARDYLLAGAKARHRPNPVVVDSLPKKITDGTDDQILRALAENARKPYVEIAKELGLSSATVHYRIAQLKKNKVLLWARPKLDLSRLNFEYFKLDIYLDDYSEFGKIQTHAFSIPNVIYAFDVIGGADIELDIHTRSFDEFMGIVDGMKEKFSRSISHIEYYQFKREYKQVYFPQAAL